MSKNEVKNIYNLITELYPLKNIPKTSKIKNIEYVLLAAEKFPQIKFSIVGSAEENYLKKLKHLVVFGLIISLHQFC